LFRERGHFRKISNLINHSLMAWIALTAEDVARRLAAAELVALKTAAKSGSQDGDEILAEAIADVTTEVRGYVGACKSNTLGEGATIPDELKSAALALVRDYLFTRLPGLKALNDEARQKEVERAVAKLKDVANCKLAIVPPATEAEDQPAGASVHSITTNTRVATRE
jgi:phage gp36-like protein